jgi:uncharacterized membrane protein
MALKTNFDMVMNVLYGLFLIAMGACLVAAVSGIAVLIWRLALSI